MDKKIKTIVIINIVILVAIGIIVITNKINNKKLTNIDEIKTDSKFENVVYDNVEEIWDDSVLGILNINKIGLTATVKEGTTSEILKDYIGHVEETSVYDGNVGLAAHNRGSSNSYFARLNELDIGDTIIYKTKFYERTYIVNNIQVIYETDWNLLQNTSENKLTLLTCISNKKEQRLCVQARQIE